MEPHISAAALHLIHQFSLSCLIAGNVGRPFHEEIVHRLNVLFDIHGHCLKALTGLQLHSPFLVNSFVPSPPHSLIVHSVYTLSTALCALLFVSDIGRSFTLLTYHLIILSSFNDPLIPCTYALSSRCHYTEANRDQTEHCYCCWPAYRV